MTVASEIAKRDAASEIMRNVEWLERCLTDAESRRDKATERGAEFAAVVARYMESPEDVGRAALRDAYGKFMSAHAGNFGPGC